MTNQELIDLWDALGAVRHLNCSPKFGYALARNRQMVKPLVDAIQEAGETPKDFIAFEQRRVELAREFADRDDADNPILIRAPTGEHFQIKERAEEFTKALEALREECKEAIDGREQQREEVEALMKADAEDVAFTPIPLADFPAQGVTSAQIECLMPMIHP